MRYFLFLILVAPTIVSAQPKDFAGLVGVFIDIISAIIPLIFALTFIVLIWGIAKAWILRADNETEVENGKKLVVVGVIGLVVMSGIWGILAILRSSLFG